MENDRDKTSGANRAISLSFPKEQNTFTSLQTKNFFGDFLPEGFTRRQIAESIHADTEDYISILRELGNECLGAYEFQILILERILQDIKNFQKKIYDQLAENFQSALEESMLELKELGFAEVQTVFASFEKVKKV